MPFAILYMIPEDRIRSRNFPLLKCQCPQLSCFLVDFEGNHIPCIILVGYKQKFSCGIDDEIPGSLSFYRLVANKCKFSRFLIHLINGKVIDFTPVGSIEEPA